jgi:hypothetical protein
LFRISYLLVLHNVLQLSPLKLTKFALDGDCAVKFTSDSSTELESMKQNVILDTTGPEYPTLTDLTLKCETIDRNALDDYVLEKCPNFQRF